MNFLNIENSRCRCTETEFVCYMNSLIIVVNIIYFHFERLHCCDVLKKFMTRHVYVAIGFLGKSSF